MGDWQECYVWRHLGSWPKSADSLRINDVVELQILEGLGLPMGSGDIVSFDRTELNRLVTLMFSTTIFGWSVGEDLYVVPDHANCILQTDHHDVIHVVDETRYLKPPQATSGDRRDYAPRIAKMACAIDPLHRDRAA
jgi:hypothetical protein